MPESFLADSMQSLGYIVDVRYFGDKAAKIPEGEARMKYIRRTAKHILNYRAKKMGGSIDWNDPRSADLQKYVEEDLRRAAAGGPLQGAETSVRRE